jgi:hypothetical protein
MAKCSCCYTCDCQDGGPGRPGSGGSPAGGGTPLPWPLPQVSTWLLLRYDAADFGARPVPAGDTWWESPDIWITGGDQYGNPIGGQPTKIFARVWNLGTLAAVPVFVNFYFIAPSLGILPSAPQRIGHKAGCILVPPLSAVVVECPTIWVPPVTEGNLHSCLLATCSAPISGDVPTVPFNPVADRHTGQRNYTVVEAEAGEEISFALHLANLEPLQTKIELMATAAWRPDAKTATHQFATKPTIRGPVNAILAKSTTPSQLRLWAQRAAILERSTDSYHPLPGDEVRRAVRIGEIRLGEVRRSPAVVAPPNRFGTVGTSLAAVGDGVELKPQQQATATFSITVPPKGPHSWFIVHLAQVSNGSITGGYTVAIGAPDRNKRL